MARGVGMVVPGGDFELCRVDVVEAGGQIQDFSP